MFHCNSNSQLINMCYDAFITFVDDATPLNRTRYPRKAFVDRTVTLEIRLQSIKKLCRNRGFYVL